MPESSAMQQQQQRQRPAVDGPAGAKRKRESEAVDGRIRDSVKHARAEADDDDDVDVDDVQGDVGPKRDAAEKNPGAGEDEDRDEKNGVEAREQPTELAQDTKKASKKGFRAIANLLTHVNPFLASSLLVPQPTPSSASTTTTPVAASPSSISLAGLEALSEAASKEVAVSRLSSATTSPTSAEMPTSASPLAASSTADIMRAVAAALTARHESIPSGSPASPSVMTQLLSSLAHQENALSPAAAKQQGQDADGIQKTLAADTSGAPPNPPGASPANSSGGGLDPAVVDSIARALAAGSKTSTAPAPSAADNAAAAVAAARAAWERAKSGASEAPSPPPSLAQLPSLPLLLSSLSASSAAASSSSPTASLPSLLASLSASSMESAQRKATATTPGSRPAPGLMSPTTAAGYAFGPADVDANGIAPRLEGEEGLLAAQSGDWSKFMHGLKPDVDFEPGLLKLVLPPETLPEQEVYYAYAAYRRMRIAVKFDSAQQGLPESIALRMRGPLRRRMGDPVDSYGRATYKDGFLDSTITWKRTDHFSYVGDANNDFSLVKIRASKVDVKGDFVLLDVSILPQNVALFDAHRRIPNRFSVEIICTYKGDRTGYVRAPALRVFAKQHGKKRMQDLPREFLERYQSYKNRVEHYRRGGSSTEASHKTAPNPPADKVSHPVQEKARPQALSDFARLRGMLSQVDSVFSRPVAEPQEKEHQGVQSPPPQQQEQPKPQPKQPQPQQQQQQEQLNLPKQPEQPNQQQPHKLQHQQLQQLQLQH